METGARGGAGAEGGASCAPSDPARTLQLAHMYNHGQEDGD